MDTQESKATVPYEYKVSFVIQWQATEKADDGTEFENAGTFFSSRYCTPDETGYIYGKDDFEDFENRLLESAFKDFEEKYEAKNHRMTWGSIIGVHPIYKED